MRVGVHADLLDEYDVVLSYEGRLYPSFFAIGL